MAIEFVRLKNLCILITGAAGDLGSRILEYLVHTFYPEASKTIEDIKLVATDINIELCRRKVYNAILGGYYFGFEPNIEAVKMDLNDVESSAELIRRFNPQIIIHLATIGSWLMLVEGLPETVIRKLYYAPEGPGYAPWIVFDLPLTANLMQAVKLSGRSPYVISAPYPDLANPVLAKLGLAPTIGMGGGDLIVPAIQRTVAEDLNLLEGSSGSGSGCGGATTEKVKVRYIAHEVILDQCRMGDKITAPYFLKLQVNGEDVSDRFELNQLLIKAYSRTAGGRSIHPLTAWSGVKNMYGLLSATAVETHVPAPLGLVGGYDVKLSFEKGVELNLPPELSLKDAIELNEAGQKLNGVETIESDGTIRFTVEAWHKLKVLLDYDCRELAPADWYSRAEELRKCYLKFKARVCCNSNSS